MKKVIRLGTREEADRVTDIVERAYSPYVERIGKKPAPMEDNYHKKILDESLHVLLIDDVLVGFIIVYFVDDALLIENIAIDPAHQGKGFGSHLIKFAEILARREKCTSITLYTNELMTKNIQMYTHMGYTLTHTSEYKDLKRVHMRKILD